MDQLAEAPDGKGRRKPILQINSGDSSVDIRDTEFRSCVRVEVAVLGFPS